MMLIDVSVTDGSGTARIAQLAVRNIRPHHDDDQHSVYSVWLRGPEGKEAYLDDVYHRRSDGALSLVKKAAEKADAMRRMQERVGL